MNGLRIHTHLRSRYAVFDTSGQLPFHIVFGLCRRSPADTDSRPLILDIAGSVLDVPSAISSGLLTIQQETADDDKQWVDADLSRMGEVAIKDDENDKYIILSSPVSRTKPWTEEFVEYWCRIDAKSSLASMLEAGRKYRIRMTSQDLGVKRWGYIDQGQNADDVAKQLPSSDTPKLVNSKPTGGNATFEVMNDLQWPPKIKTKIGVSSSPSSTANSLLEVTVTNTGSESVTVQTREHQRFLVPWGPFEPEPDVIDDRLRILDTSPHKPVTSSFQIVDSITGEVVRTSERRGTGPLIDSGADRRPIVKHLVVLKAGEPVTRMIPIDALLEGLEDGMYKLRVIPKGCRWWHGEIKDNGSDDGRLPPHLDTGYMPPLMLEVQGELELNILDSKLNS